MLKNLDRSSLVLNYFIWNSSNEGFSYWENIYNKIKENDSLYRPFATKIQELMYQMGYEKDEIK